MNTSLISSTSRVETPFIIVDIAGYSFGMYNKETKNIINSSGSYKKITAQYPNYMKSLIVNKVNGSINTYTLTMSYAIRPGDDPNLLEKVFSLVSQQKWKMKISYGDLSIPTYIYKEEVVIITKITNNIDVKSSIITYTITAISEASMLNAGTYNFPKKHDKPSTIIKELLYNTKYGILEIFYGMRDKDLVITKGLIAGDDKPVDIQAKKNISILSYLSYLVNCMSNLSDSPTNLIKKNKYVLSIFDDTTGILGGPYFKVIKVAQNIKVTNSLDVYEIDIGYPGNNIVIDFSIDNDETYSRFYNYSGKIQQSDYIYRIDNNGEIENIYSPTLALSNQLLKTTEADKTWWTKVTQYSITASVTLKGLLRPAILMTYLKINVLFYGQKHISSGYYIITKEIDQIDASGFRTTLSLTRIKEDD